LNGKKDGETKSFVLISSAATFSLYRRTDMISQLQGSYAETCLESNCVEESATPQFRDFEDKVEAALVMPVFEGVMIRTVLVPFSR
jgi:hypothetical protein